MIERGFAEFSSISFRGLVKWCDLISNTVMLEKLVPFFAQCHGPRETKKKQSVTKHTRKLTYTNKCHKVRVLT